ncbi:MAG TPA: ferredoxin [Syntrophobacteraceae bacterium]|nr:ferredoxin [Syntrophobacteraceae bacterium]
MSDVTVTFQPDNRTVSVPSGLTLQEVAARADVIINNLCGGQGVCGKCRVKLAQGKASSTGKIIGHLDKKELEEGYVLACQTRVEREDLTVWIPPESRQEGEQILTVDHVVQYDQEPARVAEARSPGSIPYYQPLCRKYHLPLTPPTLADNLSDLDRIFRELRKNVQEHRLNVDYHALVGLAQMLRKHEWNVTATVHLKDPDCPTLRAVEPGDTTGHNFGVAIDVGTTTIVAQLVNLKNGEVLGVEASHNHQARYGADVISRMIFACSQGGLSPLRNAVATTINSLVDALVSGNGIEHQDISCLVAAGNTTMTHLLLGLEPCAIRMAPYIPTANRFPALKAADVGLTAHPNAVLHCLPCVSSYVGGDITAGVLACGMNDHPEVSALIDVGTNGEIVVGNNDWLVCCSASAGPAFEGGGTKCGMRATRGAVEKVVIRDHDVSYGTIGRAKALGVCGSGLIDTIAELMVHHIIDQSGRFINFDHPRVRVVEDVAEFVIAPENRSETGEAVVVTEDDIANLMKSKGAVLAAMKVLVENLGLTFADLTRLYVAGGFGAHLNIEKAILIGLLPDIPRDRIQFIGNSSLAGARLTMLSAHAFHKAENIARHMTYFEMSVHPQFMSEFVASLFLPHTQIELFPSVAAKLQCPAKRSSS